MTKPMRRFCSLAIGVGLLGCAASQPTKAALEGSLPRLQAAIAEAQQDGSLAPRGVRELATAVVQREVRSAADAAAADRLQSLRSCATMLVGELDHKAEGEGDAAAVATLLLIEIGKGDLDTLAERYSSASAPRWRVVGARASAGPEHGAVRRKLFQDGDARVRRAALRAAFSTPDAGDVLELREAARLDPDPAARNLAIRAAGAAGRFDAVLGLRDLWSTAGEVARLAIVEAWAAEASFRKGGERELIWVTETQSGLPRLRAALALERAAGESKQLGKGVVRNSLQTGTSDERRLALTLGEFDASEFSSQVLELAQHSAEDLVRVAAWSRLAEQREHKQRALAELRKLAERPGPSGFEARRSLLDLKDGSVKPALLSDLKAAQSLKREQAALGLLRLGDPVAAASALGDDDPSVRLHVACNVLSSGV